MARDLRSPARDRRSKTCSPPNAYQRGWRTRRPRARKDAMDATETRTIESFGVERKIGLARASLAWEDLWPRLVPLLAVVLLFVAAAHLDLFAGLDPWVHTGILAVL